MQRNLIPSPGVMPIEGLVINEPESGIFFMNMNTDIAFQRESVFHLTLLSNLIPQFKLKSKYNSEEADGDLEQASLDYIESTTSSNGGRRIYLKTYSSLDKGYQLDVNDRRVISAKVCFKGDFRGSAIPD
ncbi:hypothetical protein Tco_1490968 [Tanacetum coccineum]